MVSNPLLFKDAEEARDAILASQRWKLSALYSKWAQEIGEQAKKLSHQPTPSAQLQARQLKELKNMLFKASIEATDQAAGIIQDNIYTTANAVVESNNEWLKSLGFNPGAITAAFSNVPKQVVNNLVTGNIYQGGWNLSSAIWGSNEKTLEELYGIVAAGVAQNKSTYEIAKLLEQYVSPTSAKPWNLTAPDGKKIYKKQVDYNTQRLARTLVQHSYQQSFQAVTKPNPFIHDYIWSANGSRVCDLCKARDGKHFAKDDLPMDHPNGMCVMIPNMDSMADIANKLADWVKAPDGTYPEIDNFASKLVGYTPQTQSAQPIKVPSSVPKQEAFPGINPSAIQTGADFAAQYGTSSGSKFNYWYTKLTPEAKAIAKQLKDKSGQTWQEWYEANIFKAKATAKVPKQVKPPVTKANVVTAPFDKQAWRKMLRDQDVNEFERWTEDWLATITDDERRGVRKYTGSAYESMNKYLRGRSSRTDYKKEIMDATAALAKSNLPKDTIVRRGSSHNMLKDLGVSYSPDDLSKVIGEVLQDNGFTSTSPDASGGFSDSIEYIIKVPKGSEAMYVAPISHYKNEQELLINRGARYKVQDVEFDSYGDVRTIYMELIGNEYKPLKGTR